MDWRLVAVAGAVVAVMAVPSGVFAATGASGSGGTGAEPAALWIAPVEKPGGAAPAGFGEARAGCGELVAWADGPAGNGTWAARPLAGGAVPVVIGTWHRRVDGVAPLASLGQLAAGRYQLTFDGDLLAARVLTVDCPGAGAAGGSVRAVAPPAPLPYTSAPVDASGSTIPPIGEEPVAATGGVPWVPRSPAAGLLAVGLLAAVGVFVGARRAG